MKHWILVGIVLIMALSLFGQSRLSTEHVIKGQERVPYVFSDKDSIMYLAGDVSLDAPIDEAALWDKDWKPLQKLNYKDIRGTRSIVVAARLPRIHWVDPAIYCKGFFNGFEIYIDGKRLYSYGTASSETNYRYYADHIISLPKNYPGRWIYMKVLYGRSMDVGLINDFQIGNREFLPVIDDVRNRRQEQIEIIDFAIGAVILFVFLFNIIVYTTRWKYRDSFFPGFSLFTLAAGFNYLTNYTLFPQFQISPHTYIYVKMISIDVLLLGLVMFETSFFGKGWKNWLPRLAYLQLGYILFDGITMLFYPMWDVGKFWFAIMFTAILIITIREAIVSTYYKKSIPIVFLIGILFFTILGLNDFLVGFQIVPWSAKLYGWGVLALILSLGYLQMQHHNRVDQQVQQYAVDIERQKGELVQIQKVSIQTQFEALKNQINPHFLFNTLSTLMSLIEDDPKQASLFVQELSHIYRYVLQTKDKEVIDLEQELTFIQSYNFLISRRFGDNIQFHIDVPEEYWHYLLPPLSLHLLVENAIKHNAISRRRPLKVEIVVNEANYLVVRNNLQPKSVLPSSTKIGLNNIKERYRYLTSKQVKINKLENDFIVELPLLSVIEYIRGDEVNSTFI